VIYFSVAVIFAGALPNKELSHDYQAMERIASMAWLIHVGVIAATLSSAMASFLGAPRILQSLAQDRIFPSLRFFGQGAGTTQNPRRGVLLSGGIALATVGLGNLNVIAPVVTMFFLVSYGLLNYATFYEARGSSPAFRPTFRWFHSRLSLLGALACLAVMTVIDVMSSAIAIGTLFGIYQYLKRTAGPARWADSKRSYHLQIVREHLFAIPNRPEHPRHWRPHLLAFSDDAHRRRYLLRFASWMDGHSGFTTAVRILVGADPQIIQQRAEEELRADIEEQKLNVFARVISAPDLRIGVQTLIQSFGIGPIRANTVLLNGPEQLLEARDPHGHRQ
jgi:amino acid transporter